MRSNRIFRSTFLTVLFIVMTIITLPNTKVFSASFLETDGWQIVKTERYPYLSNSSSSYNMYPYPGLDRSTNTIRFINTSVPYEKGYTYRAYTSGFQPGDGDYLSIESKDYNSNGQDMQFIASGFSSDVVILKKKLDASFSVWNYYNTNRATGTMLEWVSLGTWSSDVARWGYTELHVDNANKSVSFGGSYRQVSANYPLLYTPGGGYDGGVERYEYVSYGIRTTAAKWGTGTYFSKGSYMGELIAKAGTYPSGEAVGLYNGVQPNVQPYALGPLIYAELKSYSYDVIPPVISVSQSNTSWTNQNFDLVINVEDASEISSLEVLPPNGSSWISALSSRRFTATTNGVYNLRATDAMGNIGYSNHTVSNFDRTSPWLNVTWNNDISRSTSLNWSSSDYESGISRIDLPNGFGSSDSSNGSITVTQDGQYRFTVYDRAGNTSSFVANVTNIDVANPTITVRQIVTQLTNLDVWVVANASDDKGVKSITTPDGVVHYGVTEAAFAAKQNGSYTFTVTDFVGNTAMVTQNVTNIDKVPAELVSLSIRSNGPDPTKAKDGDTWTAIAKFSKPILTTAGNAGISAGRSDEFYKKYGTEPNVYSITGYFYKGRQQDEKITSLSFLNHVWDFANNLSGWTNVGTTDGSYIDFVVPRAITTIDASVVIPVIDTIIPEISNLNLSYTRSPNNPAANSYSDARLGDTVTATFNLSDDYLPRSTDRIVIQGQSAPFTKVSGNKYTAKVTLRDVAPNGSIAAHVERVSDRAGNLSSGDTSGQRDNSTIIFNRPILIEPTLGNRTYTKYPGQRTIEVTAKFTEPRNQPFVATVTVGKVTKTQEFQSSGTYTFTFDVVKEKIPVGDYHAVIKAESWFGSRTVTESATISIKEVYLWDKYNSVQNSSGVYIQGQTLLQKNVVGFLGAYPDNGRHTDGDWYVLKGVYVPEPELTLDEGIIGYYSNNPGRSELTITGKVEESSGEDVVVSATIGGKAKSTRVVGSNMGDPKRFTLLWDVGVDSLPEGVYKDIEVSAKNENGVQKKISGSILTVDTTKPITLNLSFVSNNANSIFAKSGDTISLSFQSSEVLVADPIITLGGLTSQVTSSGNPKLYKSSLVMKDTDLERFVTFKATYEDLAGNKNETLNTGSGIMFYPLSPVLQKVTMFSDLVIDPTRAIESSKVSVKIDSSHEWKYDPVVSISGRTTAVSKSSTTVSTGSTIMVSSDKEGTIPFNISGVVDAAGNIGFNTKNVSEGRSVVLDKTAPSFSKVTISTPSGNSIVKGGDVVNMEIVSNEPLTKIPVVKIDNVVTEVVPNSNTNIKVTHILPDKATDGAISFEISDYKDGSGLSGPTISDTTDGSELVYKGEGPKISNVSIYSSGSNKNSATDGDTVTVTFESSYKVSEGMAATIGGDAAYIQNISGNKWKAYRKLWEGDTEGNISFKVTNIAGNDGRKTVDLIATTDGSSVTFSRKSFNVTGVKMYSNNPNPSYAKQGDTVTVEFTTSKISLKDPIVRIGTSIASISYSEGNVRRYSYVLKSYDPEGILSLNISDIYDISGRVVPEITGTTDGSRVMYSRSVPYVKNLTADGYFYDGGSVTVRFETSKPVVSTPNIYIGSKEFVAVHTGGNNYEVVTRYNTSWGTSPVAITANNLVDAFGNVGTSKTIYRELDEGFSEASGDLDIIFSAAIDGGSYEGSVIPIFYASSRSTKKVVISTATLNGSSWVSGKPVKNRGTYTLKVTASSNFGSVTKEITFTIR